MAAAAARRQRLAGGATRRRPDRGRNRLHLDFGSSDAAATAARVLELGGKELEQHEMGGFGWTVFADPEGNEFCIAQADPDDYA